MKKKATAGVWMEISRWFEDPTREEQDLIRHIEAAAAAYPAWQEVTLLLKDEEWDLMQESIEANSYNEEFEDG